MPLLPQARDQQKAEVGHPPPTIVPKALQLTRPQRAANRPQYIDYLARPTLMYPSGEASPAGKNTNEAKATKIATTTSSGQDIRKSSTDAANPPNRRWTIATGIDIASDAKQWRQ